MSMESPKKPNDLDVARHGLNVPVFDTGKGDLDAWTSVLGDISNRDAGRGEISAPGNEPHGIVTIDLGDTKPSRNIARGLIAGITSGETPPGSEPADTAAVDYAAQAGITDPASAAVYNKYTQQSMELAQEAIDRTTAEPPTPPIQ